MEDSGRYEVSVTESSHIIVSEITTVQTSYARQESTDSEWQNPFRPDGDLSKEADEIVELIKEGKPITPTQISGFPQLSTPDGKAANVADEVVAKENVKGGELASAAAAGAGGGTTSDSKANGNLLAADGTISAAPGTGIEVQAGTTPAPGDASQVEHVVLKKKPICKCCVIQ